MYTYTHVIFIKIKRGGSLSFLLTDFTKKGYNTFKVKLKGINMLFFKDVKKEDICDILSVIKEFKEDSCEFSPINLQIWQPYFGMQFCIDEGCLYTKSNIDGTVYFGIPFAKDMKKSVEEIYRYAKDKGIKVLFSCAEGERLEKFQKELGKYYNFTPIRDYFEYIYSFCDLAYLSGKKYHSKRNHISAFKKKYNWSYETLDSNNAHQVADLLEEWYNSEEKQGESLENERKGINAVLKDNTIEGIKGGILKVDEKIVAFTLGSPLNDKVFNVNFEKGLTEYDGVYAMINNQFVLNELSDFPLINREEDMGVEGLRKAKLSYKPSLLLERYEIVLKNEYKEECKNLYKETFEDDDDFTDKLFLNSFDDDCYFFTEKGKLASMLFAFDVKVNTKKGKYIYAVATEKCMRGKGYMRNLFNYCEKVFAKEVDFLCLKPMNDMLFDFYSRLGFENKFYKSESVVDEPSGKDFIEIKNVQDAVNIRKKFLNENDICIEEKMMSLILSYCRFITDSKEIPSYILIEEKISGKVKEVLGEKNNLSLKPNTKILLKGNDFPFAVYKEFSPTFDGDGYLGLALD